MSHKKQFNYKIPSFMKTIRFQLVLVYAVFLVFILGIMNFGIYSAYTNSRKPIEDIQPKIFRDTIAWFDAMQDERAMNVNDLRNYSLLGTGIVMVLGVIGGYLISGVMLRPVNRISVLASRISDTNLTERIKHNGPDDEIKRLANTFDGMLERLECSFELQKQFIQDASHELRTPLAIAQTNIEVLEMENTATKEDYQQLVALLKMSLERINNVSNALLLLSERTVLPTQMVRIDIQALLSEAYDEVCVKARATGLQFDWQTRKEVLFVRGDAVQLKQVVINLLDNAIKYNRFGGVVRMKTWRENDNVVIEVSDNGIGIPAADLPHVFDRFFCVDKSRSREHGGSGLGLAIVKKIVEDHVGTVTVQSQEGNGAAFQVRLPLFS